MNDLMDENFSEEIEEYITNASLSEEDRRLWLSMLKKAAPEVAFSILSYFQEFPDKIQWATDMLKRKIQAMKTKNKAAWTKILAEEEQELSNLITSQTTA